MKSPSPQLEGPWPHRLAVLLAAATFPLIWVGGLVTTYDAGMAVPDWPGTYGYNLFLYPWQTWLFGPFDLFIEHGHRLLGSAVGIIAIALVIVVFRCDHRAWLRYAALAALGLVIFQGFLGGARVLFDERQLALLHGCVGPAFFALAVALAVFTSREWKCSPLAPREEASALAKRDGRGTRSLPATLGRLHLLTGATTLLAFGQLVLGANLRHLPMAASSGFFPVVLLFHLLVAGLLVLHAAAVAVEVVRRHRQQGALLRPALGLCGLLLVQLAFGSATWVVKYGWPEWFAGYAFAEHYTIASDSLGQALTVTAHVAIGSLILGVSTQLSLRAARLAPSFSHAMNGGTPARNLQFEISNLRFQNPWWAGAHQLAGSTLQDGDAA